MKAAWFIACAALLASCTTNLPVSISADLVFVGRIKSAQPAYLVNGDVFGESRFITFEILDQPNASVSAFERARCPDGDLGDNALLVFLYLDAPPKPRGEEPTYIVFACTLVDKDTADRLRTHVRVESLS